MTNEDNEKRMGEEKK